MDVLTIKRGNPFLATASLTYTATGEAINLSGCTILFTAKSLNDNSTSDTNAVIKAPMSICGDPANGKAYLSLTSILTAVASKIYKCDIRVYKDGVLQENTSIFYVEVANVITSRTS